MSTDAETIAKAAKQAFEASQLISAEERVRALHEIRKELESAKAVILEANKVDLDVRLSLFVSHLYTLTDCYSRFATSPCNRTCFHELLTLHHRTLSLHTSACLSS